MVPAGDHLHAQGAQDSAVEATKFSLERSREQLLGEQILALADVGQLGK
ncbi:MAG: hypothetical protein ACYCZN_14125 [Candidatus Dormibacteria bacterium]